MISYNVVVTIIPYTASLLYYEKGIALWITPLLIFRGALLCLFTAGSSLFEFQSVYLDNNNRS